MNLNKINNYSDLLNLQLKCNHPERKQTYSVTTDIFNYKGEENVDLMRINRSCGKCGLSSRVKEFLVDKNINEFTGQPHYKDTFLDTKWQTEGQ